MEVSNQVVVTKTKSKVQKIRSRVVKVLRDHDVRPYSIDQVVNGYKYKIALLPPDELDIILKAIKALDPKYTITSKTSTYFHYDAIAIYVRCVI